MIQNLQKGALNTDGQMFEGAFRPNNNWSAWKLFNLTVFFHGSDSSSLLFRNLNIEQRSGDIFPRHKAVVLSCSTRNFLANVKKVRGKKERVLGENKNTERNWLCWPDEALLRPA